MIYIQYVLKGNDLVHCKNLYTARLRINSRFIKPTRRGRLVL